MPVLEIAKALTYVVLYFITGFGLGFVVGVSIGNLTIGKGKPAISEKHKENARKASVHNSQWSPTHKKWREGQK